MTHYIQPFDKNSPPNIGGAINKAIDFMFPADNHWIVLLDHDVCFLRADSKRQLEEILETTEYDILAPVTNRLSSAVQTVYGAFDIYDMREHVKIANLRHDGAYGAVNPVNDPLAAMCLCFRVSTWKKLGGFPENNLQFDYLFCSRALRDGMKLGLCIGIYVYHNYRLLSDNPRKDIQHLL